jgi:hypothetical protein
MARLFLQVCLNHPGREAVARCPECRRYFCRECVTEHDDRLICAACLRTLSVEPSDRKLSLAPLLRLAAAGAGLVLAWACFFWLGQILLNTPSDFHEGTVWKKSLLDEE